ncbi:phosphofructokinase [Rhodococcus sp. AD45-ID]|uniref:1-phosphofructokinase family hexose kinase n=1 Tax=unclassified Rhodococcus (in: high G+C Gram-positive bacteria) TaxID=192944 RepID=UPI0005D3697E|nr:MULTISPECIES: 1-phosphofructokinase family hexose kinase [unclassified Rhodococcus (in: high G+C Gram-positive bacteria)]KJF22651.1 putative phosphofructokinase pfkB [Rhodococcus sp. AD45]PSR40242.1 phosphofructokinase [Rhodococcus sp. AD45-ID]
MSQNSSRVVTVTMNPALDISTSAPAVHATDKMRCAAPRRDPGGGGLNVARVLHALGEDATALLPSGGHCGQAVQDLLTGEQVRFSAVPITGSTRESFTVDDLSTGFQYRFVLPGPTVAYAEVESCLERVRDFATDSRFVVVSGSLPPGVDADFCQRLSDLLADTPTLLVVDTSGVALRALQRGVYLVKPSVRELRDWVDLPLESRAEQAAAARSIVEQGVSEVVVVSLGAEGALVITADVSEYVPSVDVASISGVGAGDSMVAGIVYSLVHDRSLIEAVQFGVAAGAAMLQTPGTAPCRRADVEAYFDVIVERSTLGVLPF